MKGSKINENEQIGSIIQDDNYVKWLYEFITKHGGIDDQNYQYNDEISDIDKNNISKLSHLFSKIDNYCDSEMIPLVLGDYNTYYATILWDNVFFEIGIVIGQGAICFASIVDSAENYIKLEDIRNNVHQKEYNDKVKLLSELDTVLAKIKEHNISYDIVNYKVKKYLT